MSSLDNSDFEHIIKLYTNFKEEISINRKPNKKECYLIKGSWDTDLNKNIKNYNSNGTRPKTKFYGNKKINNFSLPESNPDFVNYITTLIDCLKKDQKIFLESCELIEFVGTKKVLNNSGEKWDYSARNNKILLGYENEKNEEELILIEGISSLEEGITKNDKNIYKIKIKKNSNEPEQIKSKIEELHKKLLSYQKFDKLNLEEYKNKNNLITIETEIIIQNKIDSNSSTLQTSKREYKKRFHGIATIPDSIKKEKEEPNKEKVLKTPIECKEKEEKKPFTRFHRYQRNTYENPKKEEVESKVIKQKDYKNEKENISKVNDNTKSYIPSQGRIFYKREIKDINTENNQIKNDTNIMNENINVKEKDKEIGKLKMDIENLNKKLLAKEEEKNKIIDSKSGDIQNLKNDLNKSKKDLEDFKKNERKFQTKINTLEKDKKDLDKKITELDKELNEEKKYSDKLDEENKKLKNNENKFNQTILDLQKNEKEYKNKISKLEKEKQESIAKIQKELDDINNYNEEIINENKKLKESDKKNQKLIKDYENKEKNYLSQINELESKNKQKEKDFNNKLNKLKKDITNLEKSNTEIQNKLNNEMKDNDELYEENQNLKKKEKENNKTIKDLETQLQKNEREFSNKLLKLEKENQEINSELDNQIKCNEEINEEIKILKEKEKQFLKQIKDFENNEKNYHLDKKDLENKISKSEKELEKIKNDFSDVTTKNDKLFEENELLKNKEKDYLSRIKELEMKLNQNKEKSDKLAEKKKKEINEKIFFLENKEIELDKRMKNIEIKEQELKIKDQQLEEEKKKIQNQNSNQINMNKMNFNNFNGNLAFNKNNNLNNGNINFMNNMNMSFSNNFPNNFITPNNNMAFNSMNNIGIFNNNINFNNNGNMMANNNFSQNNMNKKRISDGKPISTYQMPTLIGLNNIGATCYLNSTLQCLSQTKALTDYFLNPKNRTKILNNNISEKNSNELQLCPAYLELIENLWKKNSTSKSYSPNQFMNIIEAMNPLFKKGQAGDSKDFIIFILEQIHRELKKPMKNNITPNEPLNQYDKNNAFKNFMYEFQNELSIISDIFFGLNETTNICLYCKDDYNKKNLNNPICYNYGIFNVIIFPLEEVKNYRNILNRSNNIMINNNNVVNLYDCFNYNQKTDYFQGENKNYCNICRQLWNSEYTSYIYSSPNVLILILNRGKNNIYKIKLDFAETIDISPFVINKNISQVYNLYGVITHLGESGPNAHFVASCKSPIDGNWYRYNDAIVSPITNIQNEVFNFGNPYILFYQKSI